MQERNANVGSAGAAVRKPRTTPDMFWPQPQQAGPPAPKPAAKPVAASRVPVPVAPAAVPSRPDRPAARPRARATVVLTDPEPTLALDERVPDIEESDCGNGCGRGKGWCSACRADIRQEALRWLRELNVVHAHQPMGLSWSEAWSREFLLANR